MSDRAAGNRPKILMVDDRPENLAAMGHVLRYLDAELFEARSGNEALSLTLHHDFALVLLDVRMPDMNGFEVASFMRDHDATRGIPIIFVTASSKDEQHVFEGYEMGAVDYLLKPITPEVLTSKVSVFLELYRHRQALEHKNQELQSFAQLAAHDLKAPLQTISGFSNNLARDLEAGRLEKLDDHADRIRKGTAQMGRLIDALLAYAQAGATDAPLEPVDLHTVIEEVRSVLEGPIQDAGAEVSAGPMPTVLGDRTGLVSLMQNIIANAIKFRSDRATVIRIESCREGGVWHLAVEDNGIGIDPKQQERIFAPLTRLNPKGEYEGAGLGLAACQKIVERHGGTIWVESALGQGTRMHFAVPGAEDVGSMEHEHAPRVVPVVTA